MSHKFKLYLIEKILFILFPFIIIMNLGSYVVKEIKMKPVVELNSDNPSFTRLEISTGSPSADRVTDKEGKNSINRYIDTLDEDTRKRVKEKIEESGYYIRVSYNESIPEKDMRHLSKGLDFDFVVYGYFKEEFTEYYELKFEAIEVGRNLDDILGINDTYTSHNATSYSWGILALNLFLIYILIKGVVFLYYKIKTIIHR